MPTEIQDQIEKNGIESLELDPGIAGIVKILIGGGVETFSSCEGGEGHAFPVPTVRFGHGEGGAAGLKALAVAVEHDLPVDGLRRVWSIEDDMPVCTFWEMTFFEPQPPP